jgi:hypothetical protein
MNPQPDPVAIAAYDVILSWEKGRLIDRKPSGMRSVPSRGSGDAGNAIP